jgi:hypothetical protein
MRSQQVVAGCLLTVAITMAPSAGLAQGPATVVEAQVLKKIGSWLISSIASYAAGKALDTALGNDNEKQLKAVETRLQAQLDQGAANRRQIEEQLGVARSELQILRKLMSGIPSRQQLAKDRAKLETDLKTIRSVLDEHEKRLDDQDQHLAENDRRLSELEREHRGYQPPTSPGTGPAPSPSSPQAGGRLKIEVRGRGNLIRLRVATHPVFLGTFRLKRSDGQADYFLPPEALAIVELFAPASRISMPQSLEHQVQILSHGFSYQTQLY